MKRTSIHCVLSVSAVLAAFLVVSCGGEAPDSEVADDPGRVTCFAMTDPSDTFPRSALKSSRGAEEKPGAPNTALAQWLATESAKGAHMRQPGWVELQRSSSLVKFGLPQAGFGIVAQVNIGEEDDNWKMVKAQPCTLTLSTPGRLVVPIYKPADGAGEPSASTINVATRNDLSACSGAEPSFAVRETSSAVEIVATYPWDADSQTTGESNGDCAGTSEVKIHKLKLDSPLGERRIFESGYVPARPIRGIDAPEPGPLG